MKLALCLFNYFPYGGLQRDFLRIARVCRDRGHDVHVYTMAWEGEQEPGIQVHLVTPKGFQNYSRIRSYINQLQQALREDIYDLVVGFNKMPGLDLYYAADVCYQSRMQQRSWWHRILPRYRYYAALERAVFAPGMKTDIMLISPLQQPEFVRCYQTEVSRFHLLPPGIANDRKAPPNADAIRQSVRLANQLEQDDRMLLMVGSGFKTKGLDRAIRALAALPPAELSRCRLFVIGQDNPVAFVRLANKLGVSDRVHFLGGRPDVPDFLLAADLLIHPAYHENTGTVLLEALVAGLPVLTVDHCGYAHYIHEADAGIVLASPFEQQALNDALVHMLTSPERLLWRQHALAFAQHADLYSMPEKAADLIGAAAKRKHDVLFDRMMALQGEIFREQKGRLTQRVEMDGMHYFLKRQTGTSWKEMLKNILQLRSPVMTMKNEWQAIEKLRALDIQTPRVIIKGERGTNPAKKESFVLLEEITPAVSLEDICATWPQCPPAFKLKQTCIEQVAAISKKMHDGGINHRDYYLCHFLLKTDKPVVDLSSADVNLYLIDMHRAQIRAAVPQRWRIKDLAGLYFSSKDAGLSKRDLFRFMQIYQGKSLRAFVPEDWQLWKKVKERGEQLYRDHQVS